MKKKPIIAIALSCVLLATVPLAACKKKKKDDAEISGTNIPAVDPVADEEVHLVSGTLHEVSVDFSNSVSDFVVNGASSYKIAVGDESYNEAASFIRSQVDNATGATLPIVQQSDVSLSAGKYILLGCNALFSTLSSVSMPSQDKIGVTGYYITTVGDDVFLQFYGTQGAQLSALAFLREVLGYEMFAADLVIYEKDGAKMPKMEITERPDYDYRQISYSKTPAVAQYGMGYTTGKIFISTETSYVHNIFDYTQLKDETGAVVESVAQAQANHPKWFSVDCSQPCFTAHGDAAEYAAMVERYTGSIIGYMNQYPHIDNIIISQRDVLANEMRNCDCAACKASMEYYGGSIAGAMLTLTNAIAANVDEYLQQNNPTREFNLVLLSYGTAKGCPVEKDANNNYITDERGYGTPKTEYVFNVVNVDGSDKAVGEAVKDNHGNDKLLTCGKRVNIMYAAADASWSHSFYEEENKKFAGDAKAWQGLGGALYVWGYEVNFYNYTYPFNSYDIILENLRFFKERNGIYMLSQGCWENAHQMAFAQLRLYLQSKGQFNVNSNYGELLNRFFHYYFGEAEKPMRRYFDEVRITLKNNADISGDGRIHTNALADSRIWKEGTVKSWLNLVEKSYECIDEIAGAEPERYAAIKKHILIESLFPRYVLCTTYAESFSEEELHDIRSSYAEDFYALGNTSHQEHFVIEDVFGTWGI